MRKALLLLVLVPLGCSRRDADVTPVTPPAPSTPPPPSAAPAPSTSSAPRAVKRGGPVTPTVVLDTSDQSPGSWHVTTTGLPAVSADGARVAYLFSDHVGMREYASDMLVVRRVDGDAPERELRIFDPKEVAAAESAPNASGTTLPTLVKKLGARVDEATALLAKGSWIALDVVPPSGEAGKVAARAEGVEVGLDGAKLHAVHATGRSLLEVDAKGWGAKGFALGQGMAPCSFRPEISGAAVDLDRHVVFVTIDQFVVTGGDACNAVGAVHAFRLAP